MKMTTQYHTVGMICLSPIIVYTRINLSTGFSRSCCKCNPSLQWSLKSNVQYTSL